MNLKIVTERFVATLAFFMVCVSSIVAEVATNDTDDHAEFVRWLEKAETGDADAQFQVALRHGKGRGVPQDESKAAEWFEKAAQQGHADAQLMIALSYSLGRGVGVDKGKALEWFRKAANQGNAHAQFQLGCALLCNSNSENEKNALPWLLKSAVNGNREGQHMCGLYYKKGWGGKEDMKSAAYWFEKAAEQNDTESQREIGICYNFGHGVKRDFDKAFYWFSKAAKQGDMEACRRLGRCYEYGFGTTKDMDQATAWYAEAADKGDEKAQEWLKTRQHVADASQNEATKKEVRAKKAQELIEKANGLDGVFAIGGFYIGMPVSDAEFLLCYYFPRKKIHSSLVQENVYGYSHTVLENGLWLDDESQCFCRTDKAAKVIRLNFEGDVRDKFFNYSDLTHEKWIQKLADKRKWALVGDEIAKTEFKDNRMMTVVQPVWHLFPRRGVRMTFFGQEKGKVDESVTLLDFGMVDFMRDYMVQYMNSDGGKAGTLRIE